MKLQKALGHWWVKALGFVSSSSAPFPAVRSGRCARIKQARKTITSASFPGVCPCVNHWEFGSICCSGMVCPVVRDTVSPQSCSHWSSSGRQLTAAHVALTPVSHIHIRADDSHCWRQSLEEIPRKSSRTMAEINHTVCFPPSLDP